MAGLVERRNDLAIIWENTEVNSGAPGGEDFGRATVGMSMMKGVLKLRKQHVYILAAATLDVGQVCGRKEIRMFWTWRYFSLYGRSPSLLSEESKYKVDPQGSNKGGGEIIKEIRAGGR